MSEIDNIVSQYKNPDIDAIVMDEIVKSAKKTPTIQLKKPLADFSTVEAEKTKGEQTIAEFIGIPKPRAFDPDMTSAQKFDVIAENALSTLGVPFAIGTKGLARYASALNTAIGGFKQGEFEKGVEENEKAISTLMNAAGTAIATVMDVLPKKMQGKDVELWDEFVNNLAAGKTVQTATEEMLQKEGVPQNEWKYVLGKIGAQAVDLGAAIAMFGGTKGLYETGKGIAKGQFKVKVQSPKILEVPTPESIAKGLNAAGEPIEVPRQPAYQRKLSSTQLAQIERLTEDDIFAYQKWLYERKGTQASRTEVKSPEAPPKSTDVIKPVEEPKVIPLTETKASEIKQVPRAEEWTNIDIATEGTQSGATGAVQAKYKTDKFGNIEVKYGNEDFVLDKKQVIQRAKLKAEESFNLENSDVESVREVLDVLKKNKLYVGPGSEFAKSYSGKDIPENFSAYVRMNYMTTKKTPGSIELDQVSNDYFDNKYTSEQIIDKLRKYQKAPKKLGYTQYIDEAIGDLSFGKVKDIMDRQKVKETTETVKDISGKNIQQGVMEGMTRQDVGGIPEGKIKPGMSIQETKDIMRDITNGELDKPSPDFWNLKMSIDDYNKKAINPEPYNPMNDLNIPTFMRRRMKAEMDAMQQKEIAATGQKLTTPENKAQIAAQPEAPTTQGYYNSLKNWIADKSPANWEKLTHNDFIRSVQTEMKKMGKSATEIANKLEEVTITARMKAGKKVRIIENALNKLSKEELDNFVDAAEGKKDPISQNVNRALKEWDIIRKEMAQEATDKGIEVRWTDEDGNTFKRPFVPMENYYPHYIDWKALEAKGIVRKTAVQQIAKSKGISEVKAEQILDMITADRYNNPHGALEWARQKNIEVFDRNPKAVLLRYLEQANERFAEIEQFGRDDVVLKELIEKAATEGADYKWIEKYTKRALGRSTAEEIALREKIKPLLSYQIYTKMGLSQILNASQNINTLTRVNVGSFMRALKEIADGTGNSRQFALDSGSILGQTMREYVDVNTGARKFLKATGFTPVELFNRILAANSGKYYALDLFERLKVEPTNAKALMELKRFGIDAEGALKRGSLSETDLYRAAQKLVKQTQFEGGVMDLPGYWTSPYGRLVTQFKSFSYNQSRFMKEHILQPAFKGDVMPLLKFLSTGVVIGEAVNDLRSLIKGKDRKYDTLKWVWEDLAMLGFGGIVTDMVQSAAYGERGITQALLGPTISTGVEAIAGAYKMAEGKPKTLTNLAIKQVPVAGQIAPGWIKKAQAPTGTRQRATRQRRSR